MKTTRCDRCGKDMSHSHYRISEITQNEFPMVRVSYVSRMSLMTDEVDLCSDCQKAVYDFIFGGRKKYEFDNS